MPFTNYSRYLARNDNHAWFITRDGVEAALIFIPGNYIQTIRKKLYFEKQKARD